MEPLDLCVRPYLCIVCKLRYWTAVELEQHHSNHENRPSVIFQKRMFETNQNINSQALSVSQGQSTVSQLSNNSEHMDFDQIPKIKAIRRRIKNSVLGKKTRSTYSSRVLFLHKPSQNSSVSSQSELVRSDNETSISKNISLAQIDKTTKVLNSSNILVNQERNHQPQNSSNSLHQASSKIRNNASSSHTLYSKDASFDQQRHQLYQNSTLSLQSELVRMLQNTASIKENILLNHIVKTNQTSNSPSVPFSANLNLPSQSSRSSFLSDSLQIPEKTTSNQTGNSLKVGESPNSYSPSVPISQGRNQLSRNESISLPPGLAQVSGRISFSANISHTRDAISKGMPILRSMLFNQKAKGNSQNSSGPLYRKSVKFLPNKTNAFSKSNLHSLVIKESQTAILPKVSFNQELNQMSRNSSDSCHPRSVKILPNNTKSISTSFFQSLEVAEHQTPCSLSVLLSQKQIQVSETASVSLHTELCKETDKTVLTTKNSSCMQIALTNQILYSSNLPQPKPSNQFSSIVLTNQE